MNAGVSLNPFIDDCKLLDIDDATDKENAV